MSADPSRAPAPPADGELPLEARAFRRTMGLFATGVTVVAVDTGAGPLGMTANSVTAVSLDPLLVLFCVDHRARLHPHLVEGRPVAISILRDDQEVLSRYFAGGWRDRPAPEYRFEAWDGAPRLVGALAAIRGEVARLYDGGDHTIVLCRVTGLYEGRDPYHPLIFFAGRYRRLAPLAAPAEPPEQWGPDGVSIYYEEWGTPPPASSSDPEPAP
ncbi:MAG: flavin reductase family protein [Armatimonadota bacterium]|nr:flavin reductase family protein [Armatimonadota bacterium]